jgi:GT2 family glycosyltransferase
MSFSVSKALQSDGVELSSIFQEKFKSSRSLNFQNWLTRFHNRRDLSLLVPVFNATDELKLLLRNSLFLSAFAEIILVDDRGPKNDFSSLFVPDDTRLAKIRVIKHKRNMGFIAAVNTGIEHCKLTNDLLVLNTDAVVSKESIDRLLLYACAFDNVATASPISNSSGFFSVNVSAGRDAQERFELLESIHTTLSFQSYPIIEETPASNGFCLYISRTSLDRIGVFDDLMFYRGYGEETDFCCRAREAGLRNLVCLQSFGFHNSASSFGMERERLKRVNGRLLKCLHPAFHGSALKYEANSELRELRELGLTADSRVKKIRFLEVSVTDNQHTVLDKDTIRVNPLHLNFCDPFDYILFLFINFYSDGIKMRFSKDSRETRGLARKAQELFAVKR